MSTPMLFCGARLTLPFLLLLQVKLGSRKASTEKHLGTDETGICTCQTPFLLSNQQCQSTEVEKQEARNKTQLPNSRLLVLTERVTFGGVSAVGKLIGDSADNGVLAGSL